MTASVLHGGSRACIGSSGVVRHHVENRTPKRSSKSGRNRTPDLSVPAEMIRRCLWAAFPARSENEVCERAAKVLDASPQTIRRMMRSNDGRLSVVWPILQLGAAAGVEVRL